MSLSGSVALELISDIFWYAATAVFVLVSTLFLKSAGSFLIEVRNASAASVYSMYSCGTRAKFLFVICRLKSLDTWTKSLSAVFTSSGDFSWAAKIGTASASTNVINARMARIFFVLFIVHTSLCVVERLLRHMQYPVHVYGMAGSGTEKWIVAGRGRDELCHHRLAFVAHRDHRKHARVICRNDALCLLRILIHRLHLIGIREHPIMTRAKELARTMEGQMNQCTGGTDQFVGPECKEVTIGFDEEIDTLLSRRSPAAASQKRQRKCQRAHKKPASRQRSATEDTEVPAPHLSPIHNACSLSRSPGGAIRKNSARSGFFSLLLDL